MTIAERNNKLKHFITCLKCGVSGKPCDVNCSTQYDAGNMGEIIENLEAISKALDKSQEPIFDKIKAEMEQLRNFRAENYDLEVYTREYNLRKEAEIKVYKLEKAIKEIKEEIRYLITKNMEVGIDGIYPNEYVYCYEDVLKVIDEKVKEHEI